MKTIDEIRDLEMIVDECKSEKKRLEGLLTGISAFDGDVPFFAGYKKYILAFLNLPENLEQAQTFISQSIKMDIADLQSKVDKYRQRAFNALEESSIL